MLIAFLSQTLSTFEMNFSADKYPTASSSSSADKSTTEAVAIKKEPGVREKGSGSGKYIVCGPSIL